MYDPELIIAQWVFETTSINSDSLFMSCCVRAVTRLPGAWEQKQVCPPCSNLRFFGNECTVLKKVIATVLGLFGAWGIVPPAPRRYAPGLREFSDLQHVSRSLPTIFLSVWGWLSRNFFALLLAKSYNSYQRGTWGLEMKSTKRQSKKALVFRMQRLWINGKWPRTTMYIRMKSTKEPSSCADEAPRNSWAQLLLPVSGHAEFAENPLKLS